MTTRRPRSRGIVPPGPETGVGPLWNGLHVDDLVTVDTAPLVYLLEDHADFAPRFAGLFEAEARGELRIAISAIAVAEVLTGPLRQGRPAQARRIEKALDRFEIVAVSTRIAVTAAQLRARTGLRLPDAIQAATAIEIGAVALVTHDRDFSRLTELAVLGGADVAR